MIDERAVLDARHEIITAIAEDSASLIAGVAAGVGESPDMHVPVAKAHRFVAGMTRSSHEEA